MAGSTTNINIQMDSDLKAQADALFGELGMDLSTAFNIFVRQALREGRIPFNISLNQPNKETIAAMLEAERIAKCPFGMFHPNKISSFRPLQADCTAVFSRHLNAPALKSQSPLRWHMQQDLLLPSEQGFLLSFAATPSPRKKHPPIFLPAI